MSYSSEVLADSPLAYYKLDEGLDTPYVAVVTATSSWEGNTPYDLFDDNTVTQWISNASMPCYVRAELNTATIVTSCSITVSVVAARTPKDFTIDGSNDGSSWTTLDTQTNVTSWSSIETKTFNFSNVTAYSYYRINVTANNGDNYSEWREVVFTGINAAIPRVVDSSATALNGMFGGTPSFRQVSSSPGSEYSILFDSTSRATLSAAVLATSKATIECWVKTTLTTATLFAQSRIPNSADGFELLVSNASDWLGGRTGALKLQLNTNGVYCATWSDTLINDGNWHHIVGILDGTTGVTIDPTTHMKIYIDGVEDHPYSSNYASHAAPISTASAGYIIGNAAIAIDEFAAYSTALSSSRIAVHFASAEVAITGISPIGVASSSAAIIESNITGLSSVGIGSSSSASIEGSFLTTTGLSSIDISTTSLANSEIIIDPSTIGSGLNSWYKAEAITGISDGGSITSWPASAGASRNLTTIVNTAPLWQANDAPNYFPCVDNAAAAGGVRGGTPGDLPTGDLTYFAMCKVSTSKHHIIFGGGASSSAELRITPAYMVALTKSGVATTVTSTIDVASGVWTPIVMTYIASTGATTFRIGTESESRSGAVHTYNANTRLEYAMYQGVTTNGFRGQMAEFGLYSTALSSTDADLLLDYLNEKYLRSLRGLSAIDIATTSLAVSEAVTTGLSPIDIPSESLSWGLNLHTTGLAPIGIGSSSFTHEIFVTTGLAPIGFGSSSFTREMFVTTGLSPISIGSIGLGYVVGALTAYTGEPHDVLLPILLTGRLEPDLPEPTPPVDYDGLVDPTVAPICVASNTAGGHLLDGRYRYSYAAWSGEVGQATAPSPWSEEVVLTTNDTVTLTYPAIPEADGYIVYRWSVI